MRAKVWFLTVGVFATGSTWAAVLVPPAPAYEVNYNMTLYPVIPAINLELPVVPSPVQSFGLAADPSGTLYVADAAGMLYSVQSAAPVGNTGFTQIADLSYSSGGLWGFSNASDSLFFFDLGSNAVTYSLPITSGLGGFDITGVTQQQSTGKIYLSGNTGLNQDSLFVLDLNTATANWVGNIAITDAFSYVSDIEFNAAGNLLAMSFYHREFDLVNPANGATTFMSVGPHRDTTGLAVDTASFPAGAGAAPEVGTWVGGIVVGLAALARRRWTVGQEINHRNRRN